MRLQGVLGPGGMLKAILQAMLQVYYVYRVFCYPVLVPGSSFLGHLVPGRLVPRRFEQS